MNTKKMGKAESRLFEGSFAKRLNKGIEGWINNLGNESIRKLMIFLVEQCKRAVRFSALMIGRMFARLTRVEPDTIMFLTYQGDYTCNPKAIADELLRRGKKYKLYWMTNPNSKSNHIPKDFHLVTRGSLGFYKAAGKTKIFVDNTHNLIRLGVQKKKGQILLQTWHGSLGIKRLDGQIVQGKRWTKMADKCRKYTDYCISNSSFETEVFQTSYWQGVPSLLYGHARNDILFGSVEQHKAIRSKVLQSFGIPLESNVLLYAPTHRDGNDSDEYPLDYEKIASALGRRFGGSWVILVRLHSRLRGKTETAGSDTPDYVMDATDYDDIQELMIASDVGLTDYSSWIFDYVLLKKPGFILANDLEQYADDRSFYYPIESTPFDIAVTNDQLESAISHFDFEKYLQKVDVFLGERGCMEDGHASERIVDEIERLMKTAGKKRNK